MSGAQPGMPEPPAGEPRFRLRGGSTLREHTARGTIVNGLFNAMLTSLGFLRGLVLVFFLTPEDYGIWGILLTTLGTLAWLKQIGIGDKYIQQEEDDQEAAFQRAFTMEVLANAVLLALLLVAVPVMVLVYGRTELLLPGFALCLILPAGVLQTPYWILYRRLEFTRQRLLQSIDPLIAFAVTIALAASGVGYWSLIWGTIVGAYAGAIVAVVSSPYRLRWRYDRGSLRSYWSFSGPLFVASLGGVVYAQSAILFGEDALGLAGAGVIALASQISQLTKRIDDAVTGTLYPVICAVADRRDLLLESFEKSNRLALMWGLPFGAGLALFAPDLVHFVIGERWEPAIVVLQATGVAAAVTQLGFSWTSYFRALGDTRPIGISTVLQVVAFFASVPLMYELGVEGYAVAILVVVGVDMVTRAFFLARLFPGLAMARHAIRAFAPALPALAAVLVLRAAGDGSARTASDAVGELALFLALSAAGTIALERTLLREALGYVRRRAEAAAPA